MKKLLFLLAIIPLFVMCKTNDPDLITKGDVTGTWYLTEIYDDSNDTWLNVSILNNYAKFNSNGTYSSLLIDETYSGTWELNEKQIICDVSGYMVYYNIIELSGNNGTFMMRYEDELTGTKMRAERK